VILRCVDWSGILLVVTVRLAPGALAREPIEVPGMLSKVFIWRDLTIPRS
jgi:hypothetical protein